MGAKNGMELCIQTLIPSLFPFFVLSSLLTGSMIGQSFRLLHPVFRLLGVPEGAESLLTVGFLGGYPVGAQNIALAYHTGSISKSEAERMLAFCNNAGPAFIFGILGQMFSNPYVPWVLWGIHVASALIVAILLREKKPKSAVLPCRSISFSDSLASSLKVMALVCGWVILFRVMLTFLERWILWLFPDVFQIIFSGILELSNGCIQLGSVPSEGLRFILASIFLSLGGLCVAMQTVSVTKGLSLKLYSLGKAMQCAFSFLMCALLQFLFLPEQRASVPKSMTAVSIVLVLMLRFLICKMKKRSSIPAAVGV